MKENIKIITVDNRTVICGRDKFTKEWTLSLLDKRGGGPIIWDKDFDIALEKFKEALGVCLAIDVMWMHERMPKEGVSDEEIKKAWKERRGL